MTDIPRRSNVTMFNQFYAITVGVSFKASAVVNLAGLGLSAMVHS